MESALVAQLLFGATGVASVLLWWAFRKPERGRGVRRLYVNPRAPYLCRNLPAVLPFGAGITACLALSASAGRPAAYLLVAAASGLVAAVGVIAYRVPAPGTPGWLLDEIRDGRLQPAVPDFGDRVARVVFVLAGVAGLVGGVYLALAGK